jgi:DNA-3-methyladenine glycosylase II
MQDPSLTPLNDATLALAVRELADRDPDLRAIVDRFGLPPLWDRPPGFATLAHIVLEQQVSLASARSLYRKLHIALDGVTAENVHRAGETRLRKLGCTGQKARYCHGLAARVLDGRLDLAAVAALPDEVGRSHLLAVPGIGPWSVDIYYLMALRRPDVWPDGDLALAAAMREIKRMKKLPSRAVQREMAETWLPWRSVAARLLWAHYLEARGQYSPQ